MPFPNKTQAVQDVPTTIPLENYTYLPVMAYQIEQAGGDARQLSNAVNLLEQQANIAPDQIDRTIGKAVVDAERNFNVLDSLPGVTGDQDLQQKQADISERGQLIKQDLDHVQSDIDQMKEEVNVIENDQEQYIDNITSVEGVTTEEVNVLKTELKNDLGPESGRDVITNWDALNDPSALQSYAQEHGIEMTNDEVDNLHSTNQEQFTSAFGAQDQIVTLIEDIEQQQPEINSLQERLNINEKRQQVVNEIAARLQEASAETTGQNGQELIADFQNFVDKQVTNLQNQLN